MWVLIGIGSVMTEVGLITGWIKVEESNIPIVPPMIMKIVSTGETMRKGNHNQLICQHGKMRFHWNYSKSFKPINPDYLESIGSITINRWRILQI